MPEWRLCPPPRSARGQNAWRKSSGAPGVGGVTAAPGGMGGAPGGFIDPAAMPFTRIVNSAIDGVARQLDATAEEIAKYAASDLVCYRAPGPKALAEAQAAAWDPILSFARDRLGAGFICTEGVVFVEQHEPARIAVKEAI